MFTFNPLKGGIVYLPDILKKKKKTQNTPKVDNPIVFFLNLNCLATSPFPESKNPWQRNGSGYLDANSLTKHKKKEKKRRRITHKKQHHNIKTGHIY